MTRAPDTGDVLIAWGVLFLLATLYDALVVSQIERSDPPLGVTAWEVAGGVGFTLVVFGILTSIETALLALLLFSASGIPMIIGSRARHAERNEKAK